MENKIRGDGVKRPDETSRDDIELIDRFRQMFIATHEIEYLDNAIGLAKELGLRDEWILPKLNDLLKMQQQYREGLKDPKMNTFDYLEDKPRNVEEYSLRLELNKEDMKTFRIIEGFLGKFKSTGDIDHINNAIGMAQDLFLKEKRIQPLLEVMVRIRDAHARGDKSECIGTEVTDLGNVVLSQDDERAIQSIVSWGVMPASVESLQHIQSVLETFKATKEVQHLDKAIRLSEDLASKDKGVLPFLEQLLSARDAYVRGESTGYIMIGGLQEYLASNKSSNEKLQNKQGITIAVSPASLESVKIISEFLDRFNSTREIEYLRNAIDMAEHCVKKEKSLQPLLDNILELRDAHARGDKSKGINIRGNFLESDKIAGDHSQNKGFGTSTLISAENLGSLEVIQSFIDTFNAVREIGYLNEAIKLAEDLVLKDKGVIPLLEYMSRMRDTHLKGENTGPLMVKNGGHTLHPAWSEDSSLVGNPNEIAEPSIWNTDTAEIIKQFRSTFKETGDIQYLDSAIEVVEELITSATSDSRLTYSRSLLASLLEDRNNSAGVPGSLRTVIKSLEEAIVAMPPDHPDRILKLEELAERYGLSYVHSGAPEDLRHAIAWTEEAITTDAPNHPGAAVLYTRLSHHLDDRYDRVGDLQDLEQAIKFIKRALIETFPNHPDRASCLQFAGKMFRDRYGRTGVIEDMEQARDCMEEALAATPHDSSLRPLCLVGLSVVLYERYQRFKRVEDIQQAIKWTEEALIVSPQDHPQRAVLCSGMAGFLWERHSRFGDLEDLLRATKWAEEALIRTPIDDDKRAAMCNNLGTVLYSKYNVLGALEDLEQALKWNKAAILATSPSHPMREIMCSSLGARFLQKYMRSDNIDDLQEAIRLEEEAVSITAPDNPNRFRWCSNLSQYLTIRYTALGAFEDLEKAFELNQGILTVIPSSHPSRQRSLQIMSQIMLFKHKRSGASEELNLAIKYSQDYVGAVPPGSPERANSLLLISSNIASRYTQTNTAEDFNYLLQLYYEAWHCQMSPPKTRIDAASKAARLLQSKKRWAECTSLLADAIRMLPKVGSRLLGREDQEYHLSQFTQLVRDTASIALQAGEDASYCLRLLELGRGVIMGHIIDCRGDLSDLQVQHPELFNKLNTLRLQVDSPSDRMEMGDGHSAQREQRRQQQLIHRLDETLTLIRNLPGFEGFQLPPRTEDLMAMASEGPIITFNSTELRSDAIIVTRHSIKALSLPKMIYSSVEERMAQIPQFLHGKRKTYSWRNKMVEGLLLWLWDVAVGPVFEALGITDPVDGVELPRVWWVGVGLLAMAPFHAAGDHSPGSTRNTISRAISSYTPSIKALSYARQKKLSLFRGNSRLLLANMPTTMGHRPLANATLEVESVMKVVEGKIHATRLDHPSAEEVLARLSSFHIIHFTCHGLSDGSKPSKSHLVLQSTSGETVDKLTVEQISNSNVQKAQIAYLSACSTAENKSEGLQDESIHMASGFQLAGFSHVLATKWVSNDRACQAVASSFYSRLFSSAPHGEDETYEDHRVVSDAFHHAVKKLRDKHPRQPILWAPFIHNGA